MEIKTFGKITEIITKEISLEFPMTIKELRCVLEEEFPSLKTIHYRIAVDDELINEEHHQITQPQSIAIMPPFSGG